MKIKIGNKTFEVSKEELESNPQEITLEFEGVLRTQEEEQTFVENHKKDARKEGEQLAVKKYREEYGFNGRSVEKLIEAVKSKTLEEAAIEPDEKLKKLNKTLEEKETALQNALSTVSEKDKAFSEYKNQARLDKKLDSYIPDNTILPKEDIKTILKTKLNFGFDEDGQEVVYDAIGNVIKDKTTASAKNPKDIVDNFFKDNQSYLKPIEGGAGGSDSGSKGKKKSIDDFISEQQEKGVQVNSTEFNDNLKVQVEAGLVDVE